MFIKKEEYAFVIGVFVGLLTLLFFYLTRRKSSGRNLLLLGVCEAGKTALFARLTQDKAVETCTSSKENIGQLTCPNKANTTLTVIDIPGHERVRDKHFENTKTSAKAILYVIDSQKLQKQLRDVTEYLFKILSSSSISQNRTPLMIVCNKQDLSMAKGSNYIRKELEKEIQLLRETKSRGLEGTNNEKETDFVYLGRSGQDFSFQDLRNKVSI